MDEKQYRLAIEELAKTPDFTTADEEFYNKLDKLTEDAKNMIRANTDDLRSESGTNYYVSNDGDDSADGTSPETAWKTLGKANSHTFTAGDALLLRRGDTWYENIVAQNGVSYSAYGTGAKPQVFWAHNGKLGTWEKTDTDGIWCYSKVLDNDFDIGVIVFNDGECYAEKKLSVKDLKNDLDFVFAGEVSNEEPFDNKLYLRCEKGNPNDIFNQIDISRRSKSNASIITIGGNAHDIAIKNLELRYGQDFFFTANSKNISMSYCVCGWTGGMLISKKEQIRYGGGGGGWLSCDKMTFDHCYIYQQFDSGVTPQYHWKDETAGIFKDFKTTDCVFENCEYTLEYFHTQKPVRFNGYDNMVFNYNICRKGGYGFGDKTTQSRYVKSWGHENTCKKCEIAHNIFDRAADMSIEIIGHDFGDCGFEVDYGSIPKLSHNVYIEPSNKNFANINHIIYKFNKAAKITLERLDADIDSVYIFSE